MSCLPRTATIGPQFPGDILVVIFLNPGKATVFSRCRMQTRSSDKNSVCASMRLSVKRVNCDETEERSVQIRFLYRTKDHLAYFSEKKNGWWGRPLLPCYQTYVSLCGSITREVLRSHFHFTPKSSIKNPPSYAICWRSLTNGCINALKLSGFQFPPYTANEHIWLNWWNY